MSSKKLKIDLDSYYNGQSLTRGDFEKLLKDKCPNLIIHITGINCEVSVDGEVYGEEDGKILNKYIQQMSKDIWIDRTYVDFKGNRFKDCFIKEDDWYEMNKHLISECLKKSKRGDKRTMDEIVTVVIYYLYSIIDNLGYDTSYTEITLSDDLSFETEYFIDKRTSWNR